MSNHTLVIDGVHFGEVEVRSVRQIYEDVREGVSARRMASGDLNVQCFQPAKIKTTITGEGILPPGMDTLQLLREEYTLGCVAYRTISSASNTITLPGYRSDVSLIYSVWVGGVLIPWDGSSVVAGAQAYRATYVPEITARLTEKRVECRHHEIKWDWSLTFEEV